MITRQAELPSLGFTSFAPAPCYNPPDPSQQRLTLSTPSSAPGLDVTAGGEVEAAAPRDAGADGAVDAGPLASSSNLDAGTAPTAYPSLAGKYRVSGLASADGMRQAVVVGPDGKALNVKMGSMLPGTNAHVVAVDDQGVTVEERAPDGTPTTFRLR